MYPTPNSKYKPTSIDPSPHHDDHEEHVERGDEVGDGEQHLVRVRARVSVRVRF